jgi:hypothetical protein
LDCLKVSTAAWRGETAVKVLQDTVIAVVNFLRSHLTHTIPVLFLLYTRVIIIEFMVALVKIIRVCFDAGITGNPLFSNVGVNLNLQDGQRCTEAPTTVQHLTLSHRHPAQHLPVMASSLTLINPE